jgi:hypothetical protein
VRELWEHFRLLPLFAWLYHTKTRLLLNSCMGVHFSSFHFKNLTELFISMLFKTQATLACVSFFIFRFAYYFWFSLNSQVLNDYSTICTNDIRVAQELLQNSLSQCGIQNKNMSHYIFLPPCRISPLTKIFPPYKIV